MKNPLFSASCTALLSSLLVMGCASPKSQDATAAEDSASMAPAASAPVMVPATQDPVEQGREVADLRTQKTALLVAGHLETAKNAYADGRLLEAENSLLAALELDAGNRDVRSLFDQVQVGLGRATVPLAGSVDDLHAVTTARVERAKAEINAHAQRGFTLLQEGNLDEAIGALSLAKAGMDGTSYRVNWEGLAEEVEAGLAKAKSERDVSMAAQRDEEKRATFERLQAEEDLRQQQSDARLTLMLSSAIESFEAEDYDRTLTLVQDILRADPLNDRARELRDTTNRARHELVNETFLTERGERFRLWKAEMDRAMIPGTEILETPNLDHWARITEARARVKNAGGDSSDTQNLALAEEIANTKIPGFQVDAEPSLEEVINKLRPYTDIPFVVTPDAVEAVDAEGIEFNLNLNRPISVQNALNVITEAAGVEVTYTFKHGVVYISSRSANQGRYHLRAHDVQDLTSTLIDHSGPKIDQIHLPDSDLGDDEEVVQGGVTGEPIPILDPDNLEALVQENVASSTWDELEGVSISYSNGHLIVWHTDDVQTEIEDFLEDMRRYISSMVTIEARFLTVQQDFLQEIGLDFRGLGGEFSPPTTMANLDDVTSGLEDNASLGLDNDGPGLPGGAESSPSAGAYFDEGGDGDIRLRTENIIGPYGERL
ncbi:MAG: hypothetical protein MK213_06830, partial [Planctomycetes bacterium]|nr:hypothetical protein [Planctomycetota bacterium]